MAEALAVVGIVASIVQLADFGCKLSVKLFSFSQTVMTADDSVKGFSSDVSLTSTVLQELSAIIKDDVSSSPVVSSTAITATQQTVEECLKVFQELDDTLDKVIGLPREKGNVEINGKSRKGMSAFERLKWPFKQPKMVLLRSNLDRLKASLILMLQVLSYARDVSNRKAASSSLALQEQMIEALARSSKNAERQYVALQLTLDFQKSPLVSNAFIQTKAGGSSSRGLEVQSQSPRQPPLSVGLSLLEKSLKNPHILAGELLICFELLNNLLDFHFSARKRAELVSFGYEKLREAIDRVGNLETQRRQTLPTFDKIEVVQILHERLDELARNGLLEYRSQDAEPECDEMLELSSASPKNPREAEHDWSSAPMSRPRPESWELPSTIVYAASVDSDHSPRHRALRAIQHSINNVNQRGERFDTRPILPPDAETLFLSAQHFRHRANRVYVSPWANPAVSRVTTETSRGVMTRGNEGHKRLQGINQAIVKAGLKLTTVERQDDAEPEVADSVPTIDVRPSTPKAFGKPNSLNGEEEEIDVVADLLARWTNLPAHRESGDDE